MADFDLDYLTSVQAALRRAQSTRTTPMPYPDPYNLLLPLSPPSTLPLTLTLPLPHNPNQAALRRAQHQDERCGSYADQRSGPRRWLKKVAGHMPPYFRLAEESGSAAPQCRHRPTCPRPLPRPPHMPPSAASGGSRGDTRARRCASTRRVLGAVQLLLSRAYTLPPNYPL